ncbi:MAG: ABC transporter ATP-binding protein, partial [Planctomycetaceae bacterium]|nr:ABC transporter ATP-binding protein [Planctomycetaceae bacterium]
SYESLIAVDGVSFEIEPGEVFGLLGPNGAGKSTTMLMIAGLVPYDAGEIRLDGKPFDPTDPSMRRMLGVVPQDLAIYPELTALENLRFFGQLYGIKGKLLQERIDLALERVGLTARASDWSGHFSGGMKRRLNFAIALLHHPKLLILDEPTVGVDPQSRSHLLQCVRDLHAEGVSVIYASHYMEEVQTICERVAIMDHGKILAMDHLHALLGRMSADLRLRISKPASNVARQLSQLAEVRNTDDDEVEIIVSQDQRADEKAFETLSKVTNLLTETGVKLHAVKTHEPNLERLFLELTGSRLRD